MRNINASIRACLMSAAILAAGSGLASAEATREIYNDAGLYTGLGPMNVFTFSQSGMSLTEPSAIGTPEGLKYFNAAVNPGWGGYGFFNVTTPGGFTKQGRNYMPYFEPKPGKRGSLRFWLKSTTPMAIGVEDAAGRQFFRQDIPSTGGVWREHAFPFRIVQSGVDFSILTSPFMVRRIDGDVSGVRTWQIDHVRYVKPVELLRIFPQTVRVNPGKRRQFTAEGRYVDPVLGEELTVINSTFSAPALLGTLNPAAPAQTQSSVLTANALGTRTVLATSGFEGQTALAVVEVTNDDLNEELGLLSESISGITLDSDSFLGVQAGPGGSTISVGPSPDVREGLESFVSTVSLVANGFAGWFITHGVSGSPDVVTRDMSVYYDGSIRFWFKATASLAGKVQLGIRSGNVPSGTEVSKLLLTPAYAADGAANLFDGQWHPMAVPIELFARPPPFADLSRIKTFAAFYVLSGPGATAGTFFVDNLRWDTRLPGPLSVIEIVPSNRTLPVNLKRTFVARGFDAAGTRVDIWPTWDFNGGTPLGTLSRSTGESVLLTARATPAAGTLRARVIPLARSGTTGVTVANIVFTQSFNVYSDAGSGGQVGVSTGPFASGTALALTEQIGGGVTGDPDSFRRSVVTLRNGGASNDAFAVWFTEEATGTRFLNAYADGYLHFFVRTTRDLEISLRSNNIPANANNAKVRLSHLGVPANGQWQEVWLSLADFKLLDPRLDFSQIKTFFSIGALSTHIGQVTDFTFDVDNVKWFTANPEAPDPAKVYAGLKAKQHPTTGLVVSFDNDGMSRAVTYDQALAAMAYTYHQEAPLARKVLDVYKAKYGTGAGFAGFHEEYQASNPAVIRDHDRTAGPNAFLLLAMLHYKAVTGSTTYDAVILGIANWIRSLQDVDNGIRYGFTGIAGTPANNKSTEHNMDAVAAFRAVAAIMGNASFQTEADQVLSYLNSQMWTGTRFRVGETAAGALINDRALDCYSWAPLALSSYTAVVGLAEADFGATKNNDTTGVAVEGFDFSGLPGAAVDKDAVWLEGTAQMVLAYLWIEDTTRAAKYMNELEKAIYVTGVGQQALTYATNAGTAYGFTMDSTHGAVSSMAWYLFSKRNFNPFQPLPFIGFEVRRVNDNALAAPTIGWTMTVPARWRRADHYVKLRIQGISRDAWGVQIYTDNRRAGLPLRYVDPTPANTINPDSDPSGLLFNRGQPTTMEKIPLAWRIQGSTVPVPNAIAPFTLREGGTGEAFNWFFMKDKSSPAIDSDEDGDVGGVFDGTAFSNGEDYVTVMNNGGIHLAQGPGGYVPDLATQFVYFQADFTSAAAQVTYTAPIYIEAFFE